LPILFRGGLSGVVVEKGIKIHSERRIGYCPFFLPGTEKWETIGNYPAYQERRDEVGDKEVK